jgi:hypothetical protein
LTLLPLTPPQVKGTVWETELDDSRVQLDTDELEALFAVKAAPNKAGGPADAKKGAGGNTPGLGKADAANLLDPKTANNTAIALSRFKMDTSEIAAALTSGEKGKFNADQLATLLAILPSPEDAELVQVGGGSGAINTKGGGDGGQREEEHGEQGWKDELSTTKYNTLRPSEARRNARL